ESIDPTLERSALFDESATQPSRWATLVSPQVLALAATVALVATLGLAMLWLLPERGGEVLVAGNDPAGTGQEDRETSEPGNGLAVGPVAENDGGEPGVSPGGPEGTPDGANEMQPLIEPSEGA